MCLAPLNRFKARGVTIVAFNMPVWLLTSQSYGMHFMPAPAKA